MNLIKQMILSWLWKVGYKAGKTIATFGKSIFSDAVMQGIKKEVETSTSFTTQNLESTLSDLGEGWASGLVDENNEPVHLSDMEPSEMVEIFSSMFADIDDNGHVGSVSESWAAAEALFASQGWIVTTEDSNAVFMKNDANGDQVTMTVNMGDGTLVTDDDK